MFYDRFLELCKEKGVKPTNAFVEAGLSRGLAAKWKSTKTEKPSADALEKMSAYFKKSIEDILGKEKAPSDGESRFKEGELIRLDADSMEILRAVRERPDMKILFSVTKNVTPEDLKKAIKIVETFKEDSENI